MILSSVIFADIFTKHAASIHLIYTVPIKALPFLNFTLIHNRGAALGFLENSNTIWQVRLLSSISTITIFIIFIWLFHLQKNKERYLTSICLSLILAGAIGNLYDRLTHEYVVDFLDFHIGTYHWPIFNLADSAIFIGAITILIMSFHPNNELV